MSGMVQGAAQALDHGEESCLVELTGKAEQELRSDGSSDRSIRQDHLHSAHNQVTGLILSGGFQCGWRQSRFTLREFALAFDV